LGRAETTGQATWNAKVTKAKAKVVADKNPANEKAYQKAKQEMATHRIASRGHTPHVKAGDAIAKPATLKVKGTATSPS